MQEYFKSEKYKNQVKQTFISKAVSLPKKIREILINIENILAETIEGKQLLTAKSQFTALLKSIGYLKCNINYWTYMKSIFNIDMQDILNKQCLTSQDQTDGYISVLNTSIFIIPTYNSNLIY